ncbi:MAG: hypothetical protein ABIM50_09875 [Novosphingobium sp.]
MKKLHLLVRHGEIAMPGSPLPGGKPVPTFPEGAPLMRRTFRKCRNRSAQVARVKANAEYLTQRSAGEVPAPKRTVSRKRSTRGNSAGLL